VRRVLIWGAGTLGGVTALALTIIAIGALLPVAHQVSRSQTFAAPAPRLWDLSVALFHRTNKGSYAILKADRPTLLVTGITRRDLPFGGMWTYEFVEHDQVTTLTITERGEVYNPLFRFVSRFIVGYYGSINHFFAALAADLEHESRQTR
jgi:hypothetical protein